jgi:hypothetical protein
LFTHQLQEKKLCGFDAPCLTSNSLKLPFLSKFGQSIGIIEIIIEGYHTLHGLNCIEAISEVTPVTPEKDNFR